MGIKNFSKIKYKVEFRKNQGIGENMIVVNCEESPKVVPCPWIPRTEKGKVSKTPLGFRDQVKVSARRPFHTDNQ